MYKRVRHKSKLAIVNNILLAGIVVVNIYIIAAPFLPQLTYKLRDVSANSAQLDNKKTRDTIDRSRDHIVISRMALDQKIWIGDNTALVDKGVWHIPRSSTPDKGSNTVLVGHRFTYNGPAVFYHLDKMKIYDPIVLSWGGKIYYYKVQQKKVVKPTELSIESPTDDPTLTLYTCTPLWSTKERLVIIAHLESIE